MLNEPAQFEPLTDELWDRARIVDAIATIIAGTDAAFSLISRPPPKSATVSPETTARWLSTQSTVSFALMQSVEGE